MTDFAGFPPELSSPNDDYLSPSNDDYLLIGSPSGSELTEVSELFSGSLSELGLPRTSCETHFDKDMDYLPSPNSSDVSVVS